MDTAQPFLTDGVSTHKNYRDFANQEIFSGVGHIQCGGATFIGGIIGYVDNYAIILTTGHGFHIAPSSDDHTTNAPLIADLPPGLCHIRFDGKGRFFGKSFKATHAIFNSTYLTNKDSPHNGAHDFAFLVVQMDKKDQEQYTVLPLPNGPLRHIGTAQFCGYGTSDKQNRSLGLFGGDLDAQSKAPSCCTTTHYPRHKPADL